MSVRQSRSPVPLARALEATLGAQTAEEVVLVLQNFMAERREALERHREE